MNKFASYSRVLPWFMALLLGAFVAACGGGGGGRDPILGGALPGLVSLAVTPASVTIPITGTQQFTAIATYSDGSSRDVTANALTTWASSNAAVAANPISGWAIGSAAGTSNIAATFGGKTATATLTVNAATPVSFVVTPTTATIPVSGTQQFAAIQTFSDGTTIDRTTTSTWSPSGPSVANATVGAATGLAKGVTVTPAGAPVFVNASFTPVGGAALVATPATLIVTAATSKSFVVKPAAASIPVGGTQQYTAIETFSDGTTFDRTATSTWTSPDLAGGPGVATMSANGATGGLATGKAVGTSTITAAYGAYVGALAATAPLTVTAATSKSFVVKPAAASIPVNGTQQYTAIETFSDGTTFDRTATSTWTSPDFAGGPGVATMSANDATRGLATGKAVGTSTITATFGAQIATAPLTVTAATVTSINVTPAAASILVGATQQYTATAIYSDGSSLNVTANPGTVWTSVDVAPAVGVAKFAAGPPTGIATGVAAGKSNITAAFGGKTSPLFPAVDGAQLTVTAVNTGPAGPLPNLRTAAPYGIMAWDAMTINGGSHIYGDVALPGGVIASVVGPGTKDGGGAPNLTASAVTNSAGVTPGQINTTDNGTLNLAQLAQLQADLNSVYANDLMVRPAPMTTLTTIASAANVPGGTFILATDLSGYVLSPGVYDSNFTYGLSKTLGPLVLDAKGNPDAVFIIRSQSVGSGFTSTDGSVALQGGAQAKNIFWVVTNNATIGNGANTFFQGTVVAGNVITLGAFTTVQGRMLAGARGSVSGALTLTGTNIITVPQ